MLTHVGVILRVDLYSIRIATLLAVERYSRGIVIMLTGCTPYVELRAAPGQ